MELRSLGRRTDLIFTNFSGQVLEREAYWVIRTRSNPTYHWGNYVIFESAPTTGDFDRWNAVFDAEIASDGDVPEHRLFTWDVAPCSGSRSRASQSGSPTPEENIGVVDDFVAAGMRLESAIVLTTSQVETPPHPNRDIDVRPLVTDRDWQRAIESQVESRPDEYSPDNFRKFKIAQMGNYRRMSDAGLGHWFGAFLEDELVADLGLFHRDGVARYQQVSTSPRYRRQGICGTLVHAASAHLTGTAPIETFVMEADPEYHAARIYESVGFRRQEANHALYWHSGMNPSSRPQE